MRGSLSEIMDNKHYIFCAGIDIIINSSNFIFALARSLTFSSFY
jgi:hypothetical protein